MSANITGVILAGGKSSRMGQPKAFLPYKGLTLIEHIVSELKTYCQTVLVSANESGPYGFLDLPILKDHSLDCGPLGGIEAGLNAAPTNYCFVVPCDLPCFSGKIIKLLAEEIKDADICVPMIGGFYEPLVALYSKSALPAVTNSLVHGKFKVTSIFESLQVKILSEETIKKRHLENIFVNINTITEYKELLQGDSNG